MEAARPTRLSSVLPGQDVPAPATQASTATDRPEGTPHALTTALGAVVTGIGILGWVTFFGGAILWIRASAAHLPATESVAVIPRPVLLIVGAKFAAFAALIGLLALAAVYLWDAGLRLSKTLTIDNAESEAAKLDQEIARNERIVRSHDDTVVRMEGVIAALLEQGDQNGVADAKRLLAGYRQEAAAAKTNVEELRTKQEETRTAADNARRKDRRVGTIALGLFLFGSQVVVAIFFEPLSTGDTLIVISVAAGLTLLSFLVLLTVNRPIWFGVAVFIAMCFFTGFITYLRTKHEPKVEPAAALRSGAGPLCGFYIAQTSDYLYLGTYARPVATTDTASGFGGSCTGPASNQVLRGKAEGLPPRLIAVPRQEITDMSIGHLMSLDDGSAARRSAAMALDLCQRRTVSSGSGSTANPVKVGCSARDLEHLRMLVRHGPVLSPESG